jgi:hypothetical protein
MNINIHFWKCLSQFFLEWKIFRSKLWRESKIHILYSTMFCRKSCLLWDNVEKILYSEVGLWWQSGACALHAGYLGIHINTQVVWYCFPSSAVVKWTRHNIALYVPCFSVSKSITGYYPKRYWNLYKEYNCNKDTLVCVFW